jgi:chitodextrinase
MVAKLQQTLLESAGLSAVTIAGQSVTYGDLQKQLEYWQKKVARENGNRSVIIETDFRGV